MTPRIRALLPFALLLCLCGCKSAGDLLYQPKPEDPNDGYNSLPQAGVNTVMDWGPDQGTLLKEFTDLKREKAGSQKLLDDKIAENLTLQGQLGAEREARQKEQGLRLQADALVDSLQKRSRELEATILSLRIEKAKLEQTNLLAEIAKLQRNLEDVGTATEATGPGDR